MIEEIMHELTSKELLSEPFSEIGQAVRTKWPYLINSNFSIRLGLQKTNLLLIPMLFLNMKNIVLSYAKSTIFLKVQTLI